MKCSVSFGCFGNFKGNSGIGKDVPENDHFGEAITRREGSEGKVTETHLSLLEVFLKWKKATQLFPARAPLGLTHPPGLCASSPVGSLRWLGRATGLGAESLALYLVIVWIKYWEKECGEP